LIQEQFPPQLVRENGTKGVSRQQHKLAQVLKKRQQRRAQSAKEANHYGKVITDQWTVNVRYNFNGVVVAMQFIFEKTDWPILLP
jgi:hypothetical protein